MTPLTSLMLSLALGGAAILGARLWLQPQEADAIAIPETTTERPALAKVLVAKRNIPRGAALSEDMTRLIDWPAQDLPEGAFTAYATVGSTKLTPRRTLRSITSGEPILPAALSDPGVRPTLSARLDEGFRAATISTDVISGVGGFVMPGDRVDVVLTRELHPESNKQIVSSEVVLQDVTVLAIEQNDNPQTEEVETAENVTLAVSLPQVQILTMSQELGTLSLALRGVEDTAVQDVKRLVSQSNGNRTRGRPRSTNTSVIVNAGEAQITESVPRTP